MKTYTATIIIALIMFIGACKKDNTNINPSLTGKWKLTGSMISSGGPMYWVPIPDKPNYDYIMFNANGIVSGTIFSDYRVYAVKDSVTITLTKDDKVTYENFRYHIKGDSLTMAPAGPSYCIEGCATMFVKVK